MKNVSLTHLSWLVAVSWMLLAVPDVSSAQTDTGPVSIRAAAGTHANVGGDTEAVSVGFAAGRHVTFLVSAERLHLPMKVERHDNVESVTRGGTTTFVSGEIQVAPAPSVRVAPYALAGEGAGVSRPNVNDRFPDLISNNAALFFFGGGVRMPASSHLSVFADARFTLQIEGDNSDVFLFVPIRAGVSWTF